VAARPPPRKVPSTRKVAVAVRDEDGTGAGEGTVARPPAARPTGEAGGPLAGGDAAAARPRLQEPVWLVRAVLVLFLVGFAAFLAREVRAFLDALP